MRKINYNERAVKAIIQLLTEQNAVFGMHEESIEIEATKRNEDMLFKELNRIVAGTKYMVQKDIKSVIITIFNGSV